MSEEVKTKASERAEFQFDSLDEWQGALNMFHNEAEVIEDGEFYVFAFDEENNKIGMFNKYTEWGYVDDPKGS